MFLVCRPVNVNLIDGALQGEEEEMEEERMEGVSLNGRGCELLEETSGGWRHTSNIGRGGL